MGLWGAWWPECRGPVQWGRQVVLDCVVVVVGVCRSRVAPWHRWERWQGLPVVVGVSVIHVMVWCGPVRLVGRVARGGRLCWVVLVMERVGVAVVLGRQGVGVGGGGGVLMQMVVPRSLALPGWRPRCGVDLCGQRSLTGPLSRGAAVRRWWWELGRVLLVVCPLERDPNQSIEQETEFDHSMAQGREPHRTPIPRACIWRESFV